MNYKIKSMQLVLLIAFLFCGIGISAQSNNTTELVYISTNTNADISFYQLNDIDLSNWSALNDMTTQEMNQYFIAIDGINAFSYSNINIAKIEVENDQAEEIFRTIFFLSPETILQNIYQN